MRVEFVIDFVILDFQRQIICRTNYILTHQNQHISRFDELEKNITVPGRLAHVNPAHTKQGRKKRRKIGGYENEDEAKM